jgi:hypothetical protein
MNDKILKQVEMASRPIPVPGFSVNIGLVNFPPLAQVMECLVNKKPFGLKSKSNAIIFDPEALVIYDYAGGDLVKTICGDEANFVNYLKLAAIEHRTFLTSATCIEMVKPKKVPQNKLITNI